VISNGPFYLDRYSPDSRMIVIKSFDYGDYIFEQGKWEEFENIKFPSINSVEFVQPFVLGSNEEIRVSTENSSEIHYFVVNTEGKIILDGIEKIINNNAKIKLGEASEITEGVNTVKIFAASDEVLKPYEYSKSFIVIGENKGIPNSEILEDVTESQPEYWQILLIIPIFSIIAFLVIRKSRLSTNNK